MTTWSHFVPDWASVETAAESSVAVVKSNPTGAPSVLICLVILVSIFFGARRGLSREILVMAGWIGAPFAALSWHRSFADWAFPSMQPRIMGDLVGYCAVFVIVLVISAILSGFFSRMVRKSVLAGSDIFLGGVFGALRGCIVVVTLYFISAWVTPGGTLLSRVEAANSYPGLSTALTYLAPALSRFMPSDLAQPAGTRHDLAGQDLPGAAHTQSP
ncbi:CvpA family protein [Acetobacter oeni]|nr:CvpA family protein [Acetobacter oeni]MBB3883552.1 membrane protein required for colicin V production [Acetobacter oeni]